MEITCLQMDVLISFYIDGELTSSLREKVEEHLKNCSICREKYNIISELFNELRETNVDNKYNSEDFKTSTHANYKLFRTNLSAYIDNELPDNDNIKVKKIAISNGNARKELEDNINIRKLMNDSFKKTRMESKEDFSKKVMKQLTPNYNYENLSFSPIIKVAIAFLCSVLIISAIIICILSFN